MKTTQSVNMRLFFGVYQKTQRKKTKSDYNLKASYIGLFSA